jgi:hypothetical protein
VPPLKVPYTPLTKKDFADNNLKMILGFFWSLFKKYRIQTIKQDGLFTIFDLSRQIF